MQTVHAAATAPASPAPGASGRPVSRFEFWPIGLFYLPVVLYWLWLAVRNGGWTLPTAANPLFRAGGMCGDSKAATLGALIGGEAAPWVAPFVAVARTGDAQLNTRRALHRLAEAGLALPVVAKPDVGCRGAGVRLVETEAELAAYLAGFPRGARLVLQRYIPYEGEAGVFYARLPGEARGRILSLALKYFPHVVGDGCRSLRQLIHADPRAGRIARVYLDRHAKRLDWVVPAGESVRLTFVGNHFRGAICRDANFHVTAAMTRRFDEIARSIPEFYFGRFDVRFRDLDALKRGEDFAILELNGVNAEPLHIWDRDARLAEAYRTMLGQVRLSFEIGRRNRARGFRPVGLAELFRLSRRDQRLMRLYPLAQ